MQQTTAPNDKETEPFSSAKMEIEADQSTKANRSKAPTPEISELINELKHDIATIAIEMREKFNEIHAPPQLTPFQLTPFLT